MQSTASKVWSPFFFKVMTSTTLRVTTKVLIKALLDCFVIFKVFLREAESGMHARLYFDFSRRFR